MMQKKQLRSFLISTAAMLLCILINCFGRQFASAYNLPGRLDSYGTFFAAYAFGPVPGAVVGTASNLVLSFSRPSAAVYSIVSVFLGLSVGCFARKKYFETVFTSMTVAGAVTCGAAVLASVLNAALNDFSTGNLWGDGVRDFLCEMGLAKFPAMLIGELYLEFPDKLLTVLVLYALIHLSRHFRNRRRKYRAYPVKELSVILAAGICAAATAPAHILTAEAAEESIAYIQTVYNGENGLLCGHANAIAETSDGILWIGTYAGLYRYNGAVFAHMDGMDAVRNVNCLYTDDEGRLWVGTNDNGAAIVINEEIVASVNSQSGLPSDSIRSIVQSENGDYYIGTSAGLVTVRLEMGISVLGEIEDTGYVSCLSADREGNVTAVNSEGRLFLIRSGHVITSLDTVNGQKPTCCCFGADGTLYVGTDKGWIAEYSLFDGGFTRTEMRQCSGLTKINHIYFDSSGKEWICADNGIGYMNSKGVFARQETGDFNHSVENMSEDYQGNLWFASSRMGLLRLLRSPVTDVFADAGLKPCVVNSTAIYHGVLYIGADDGLRIVNTEKRVPVENHLTELLEGSRIRCLYTDDNGHLWICSYGAGLVCVSSGGTVTNYSEEIYGLGSRVRVCTELSDGTVAAAGSTGLFFLRGGKATAQYLYGESFGYAPVLCMLEAEDGTLYAGTDGDGITVMRNGEVVQRLGREDGLTSGVILRMVSDPEDGSIYIVTSNSICRMADGTITQLRFFPYSNNYDMFIGEDGRVFVTGSAGVYVMKKNALLNSASPEYTLLNSQTGLVCALTANAWNALDQAGNLYLSADHGVFVINLKRYLLKQTAYRLSIPEVHIDDQSSRIMRGTDLHIDRGAAKVEFFPEIINYTLEDPVISYYLEGFDTGWKDIRRSELKSVPYTNLKPGNYKFRLAVRDEDGSLLEETVLSLTKESAIYDNAWFRYYMIVVAAVFVGWLTWFITRTQMQRTLELQKTKLAMAMQQLQMGNETILAIAKTVDAKDVRTSKHSQRVSDYSAMIAAEYGFTEEEQENLRKAALLHDIGKIGIPDSVLNKPSRLTDEEYAVMKTHVTKGAEILKDFTLIEHVVEGARYHHERYDGKGYPEGLSGTDIPLYGRIIAIADAFDAMTANRVYRKKQDFEYVLGELRRGRGTQFDPELLDIFLRLIEEKKIDIEALYQAPAGEEAENT